MKLIELKSILKQHPAAHLRFLLPKGNFMQAHAHVTEVARIEKTFIDCGGTFRRDSLCRLQTWHSDDTEHRLTAGKLMKILDKAHTILGSEELEVDIEHQIEFISQFPLESVEVSQGEIVMHLTERHTACLAEDKCKPAAPQEPAHFNLIKFNLRDGEEPSSCCAGT